MVGVLMLPETSHRRLDSVEQAGESRMTGRLSRPVWRGEENHPLMRWYPSYPMASGRCCAPGCGRAGASRRRSYPTILPSSNSCIMPDVEEKPCSAPSWPLCCPPPRNPIRASAGCLAMAWLSPDCRGSFARIFPLDDVPVGYRPVARRQAKHGLERDMSIKSSVVAEDEFVQVRIDVLAAEVGAEAPPLQEGEDPMDPFEVPCHAADHAGIVAVVREPQIGRVRHQCRARRNVCLDERVDVRRLVARDRGQPDAAGHRVKILRIKSLGFLRLFGRVIDDLNRANDEHFAG